MRQSGAGHLTLREPVCGHGRLERWKNVDLHPDTIRQPHDGDDLRGTDPEVRRALNENPGEHFTPRHVVHLMVKRMTGWRRDRAPRKGPMRTAYHRCCGSSGMPMITREYMTVGLRKNGNCSGPDQSGRQDPRRRPAGESLDVGGLEVRPDSGRTRATATQTTSPTSCGRVHRRSPYGGDHTLPGIS